MTSRSVRSPPPMFCSHPQAPHSRRAHGRAAATAATTPLTTTMAPELVESALLSSACDTAPRARVLPLKA